MKPSRSKKVLFRSISLKTTKSSLKMKNCCHLRQYGNILMVLDHSGTIILSSKYCFESSKTCLKGFGCFMSPQLTLIYKHVYWQFFTSILQLQSSIKNVPGYRSNSGKFFHNQRVIFQESSKFKEILRTSKIFPIDFYWVL